MNLNNYMTLNYYQDAALKTKKAGMPWYYSVLKLTGEAGEVSEKFGKLVRDKDGQMDEAFKKDITKELGDVLWYVSSIADDLGISLEEVAQINLQKLADRQNRGVLGGSGDDR